MTINEDLLRQARPMRRITGIAGGIAIATMVALEVVGAGRQVRVNIPVAAGILIVVGTMVIVLRRLKCPLCGHGLSAQCQEYFRGPGLPACPYCQGSFDQPMPQTPFL